MNSENVLLKLVDTTKVYESGLIRIRTQKAVNEVSLEMKKGEILSLVGESGSGKTTIAKMVLRLIPISSGKIFLNGTDITTIQKNDYYKKVQAIFQDPYSSFNYFYSIDRVLNLAFKLRGKSVGREEKKQEITDVLKSIGINYSEVEGRYPHQLSGGQLQRFLIARILLIKPDLLIADEPTSMIDASSRAGILNLIKRLRDEVDLSVLFITHDIGQAQYIAEKVCIMKEGKIVEQGLSKDVFINPQHPYSKNLLSSVPSLYRIWDMDNVSKDQRGLINEKFK